MLYLDLLTITFINQYRYQNSSKTYKFINEEVLAEKVEKIDFNDYDFLYLGAGHYSNETLRNFYEGVEGYDLDSFPYSTLFEIQGFFTLQDDVQRIKLNHSDQWITQISKINYNGEEIGRLKTRK